MKPLTWGYQSFLLALCPSATECSSSGFVAGVHSQWMGILSINLARYCMKPKNVLSSFSGCYISSTARIYLWSCLWPSWVRWWPIYEIYAFLKWHLSLFNLIFTSWAWSSIRLATGFSRFILVSNWLKVWRGITLHLAPVSNWNLTTFWLTAIPSYHSLVSTEFTHSLNAANIKITHAVTLSSST